MDFSQFDGILWFSFRGLNFFAIYMLIFNWSSPTPWGKFDGLKTFAWSKFNDRKYDPGMSFAGFTVIMEIPTLIYTFLLFPHGQHASNPKAWILMAPYVIHYLHRALIYPILTSGKHIQKIYVWWLLPALWVTFSVACSQTREISHHKDYDNDTWFWLRVLGGLLLFVCGLWIRIRADHILTGLKRKHGKYVVPSGWLFELVDCPHFLGELMEWLGWTIMTGSMSTLWVFIYVCSLLVPRAYHTHNWYLAKFEDYPKTRKTLIPYLF